MAITPGGRVGDASPTGKKGGKRRLSDQERELWHALRRKGVPAKRAYAMTIGIVRNAATRGKWGRGKVRNPAVRAAAAASVARRQDHSSDDSRGIVLDMANPTQVKVLLALRELKRRDIDLVGPKGYVHGWKFVGAPGVHAPRLRGTAGRKAAARASLKAPAGSREERLAFNQSGAGRRVRANTPSQRSGSKKIVSSPVKSATPAARKRVQAAKKSFIPNAKTDAAKKINAQELEHRYSTSRQNNEHAVNLIPMALDAAAAHRQNGNSASADRMENAALGHARNHVNIFSKRKDAHGKDARAAEKSLSHPGAKKLLEDVRGPQKSSGRPKDGARYQVRERIEKPGTHDVIDTHAGNQVVSTHTGRNGAYANARERNARPNVQGKADVNIQQYTIPELRNWIKRGSPEMKARAQAELQRRGKKA